MTADRRRTTLAAVSPSQLNSGPPLNNARLGKDGSGLARLSTLGSRLSMVGGKQLPGNAPSRLAQNHGPRRSSTYGKTTSGNKPDPRPLNDKAYQASCARCLITYLSTHGYDQPVSPKILASPTSKDFTSIVHFLMGQVDPHLNPKTLGKIEDDVPAFFKRMRYPFQISKSSLFAVGSPHTWPSLLAALVWVVELLNYEQKAATTAAGLEDERQKAEHDFFAYVSASYRHFLAGDDAKCDEVDGIKAAEFKARAAEIEAGNAALQQEKERLAAEIHALRDGISPLSAAKTKLEEHKSDREKFRKLIENLQAQKQSLNLKVQERQSDLGSKTQQLAQVEQECEELQERVSSQTFNRDDVSRMNDERVKRDGILQSAELAREVVQKRVRDGEVAVEHRLDELDVKLQDYNTAADRLQLIPVTAKHAGGVQFEAKLQRSGSTATEMVNVDFKGSAKAALSRMKDAAVERARQLVEEGLALQERRDTLAHSLTERAEENAMLQVQVHKLDKQLARSKEEREADIAAVLAEAERIKGEVMGLRDATSHSIADSSGRVRVLQSQCEETAKACELERAALAQDLTDALLIISEHKQQTGSILQRTHARVADITAEVVALKL